MEVSDRTLLSPLAGLPIFISFLIQNVKTILIIYAEQKCRNYRSVGQKILRRVNIELSCVFTFAKLLAMKRRLSSDLGSEVIDENVMGRRLSLPASVHAKGAMPRAPQTPEPARDWSDRRRHTLMPLRSSMKTIGVDRNLDRRVSFAGQVSVHKFQINTSPRRKPRSSLGANGKLSIHEYMQKQNSLNNTVDSGETLDDKQQRIDREIADIHAMKYQEFEIDEDNSTQTMEMSIELTNQIREQQKIRDDNGEEVIKEDENAADNEMGVNDAGDEGSDIEGHDSFRSLFEDLENEDDNNYDTNERSEGEITMEFTQPVPPVKESITTTLDANKSTSIPLAGPIATELQQLHQNKPGLQTLSLEDTTNNDMEITEKILAPIVSNTEDPMIDDVTEIMDLTDKVSNQTGVVDDSAIEIDDQTQTMNLTQVFRTQLIDTAAKSTQNGTDEPTMELTEPGRIISDSTMNINDGNADVLSTVMEQSEPATMDESITPPTPPKDTPNENDTGNSSLNDMSFGTEMVPLAEVSVDIEEQDNANFESADILEDDDNYINVTLETFLRDINVQFYESIGPSEKEIEDTINLGKSIGDGSSESPNQTSVGSFSSSSSNAVTPIRPTNTTDADDTPDLGGGGSATDDTQRRQTLLDYIDSANNELFYHYLSHIINQYRSSIGTISNMVTKFSHDVSESNLLTMREYYNQESDVKMDLRTNYQSLASFTRKKSQNENLLFISGLIEQLIESYSKSKEELVTELENAMEWRKNVLMERQQMIETKLELSKIVEKLLKVKNEWSVLDIPKWKEISQQIKTVSQENLQLELQIKDLIDSQAVKQDQLNELQIERNSLNKEVTELQGKLKTAKLPIDLELSQLSEKLRKIEIETGVRMINEDPLHLIVKGDLKVLFSLNDGIEIEILRLHHFKPYEDLVNIFIHNFQEQNQQLDKFEFIKELKNEWYSFKQIWKELAMIYYLHPTEITQEGFEVDYKIGKAKFICSTKDLINKNQPIKIVTNDQVKFKLINGQFGNLDLFKRIQYD